jgi:uncharacterized protein HemY
LDNLAWHLVISDDPTIRNPERAVGLARRAVELAPDQYDIRVTLGMACSRTGDWSEAVRALEKGLALPPWRTTIGNDNASTWLYLAMAHSQLGHAQKARSWYDKAAEWMDKNAGWDEGLWGLRAEAAELLGIKERPAVQDKEAPPRKE